MRRHWPAVLRRLGGIHGADAGAAEAEVPDAHLQSCLAWRMQHEPHNVVAERAVALRRAAHVDDGALVHVGAKRVEHLRYGELNRLWREYRATGKYIAIYRNLI